MPSETRSVFFDEWQACLRAHYIHVLRANDLVTEPTLREVLLHTGLTEVDLAALRAEAEALGAIQPDLALEAAAADTPESAALPDDELLAEGDDLGDELSAPL